MTDTVALYDLCENLFQRESINGVPIITKDEIEHTMWLEDSTTGTYISIRKRLQSRRNRHLDVKTMDEKPGGDYFYQYLVLETAGDASSCRLVGVGNHPQVAAEQPDARRHGQDSLLERLASATPFPSFQYLYWGATQQDRLAEVVILTAGNTKDKKGSAPYYYHFRLQSFSSKLSSLFRNDRLVLPAFWDAVEQGILRNITEKLKPCTIRWSGELEKAVLIIGDALYAPSVIWEQRPSLKIADLRELVII